MMIEMSVLIENCKMEIIYSYGQLFLYSVHASKIKVLQKTPSDQPKNVSYQDPKNRQSKKKKETFTHQKLANF